MMTSHLKTEHVESRKYFYFLLMEKIGGPIFLVWMAFFISVLYIVIDHTTKGDIPSAIYLALAAMTFFPLAFMAIFTLVPAYYRAKFLRKKGYCIITPDHIEAVCCGKHTRYEYKNRSIKIKKHKDGSKDIFIGKSFIDFIKHTSFILTPKWFRAQKALMGFGAPLYRVTNADEVISYLKENR